MHRAPFGVFLRQHPSLATAFEYVQQPAKYVIKVNFPGLGPFPCRFQNLPDPLKLLTAYIAWINHSIYLSKICRILLILNLEQVLRGSTISAKTMCFATNYRPAIIELRSSSIGFAMDIKAKYWYSVSTQTL